MLRIGEWIAEPVTPLFESWLLTAMEDRMHAFFREQIGQIAPRPYHVVVNGWYFYSINFISGRALLRSLPGMLVHLVRTPRHLAGVIPPTVRYSFPIFERMWREDMQPRYRAAVTAAERDVERVPVAELPEFIDGVGRARRRVLRGNRGPEWRRVQARDEPRPVLSKALARRPRRQPSAARVRVRANRRCEPTVDRVARLVVRTDSSRGEIGTTRLTGIAASSRHATTPKLLHLRSSPRRLAVCRAFRRLLADAQHIVPIREEQTSELTIAWPVLRRASSASVRRSWLAGVISESDDVFFLTRDEVLAALAGTSWAPSTWRVAARPGPNRPASCPPASVGRVNPLIQRTWDSFPGMIGAERSDYGARVRHSGISRSSQRNRPGRFAVRTSSTELQPGEILVAPLTAPAWTPLFLRAAAVVTDVGSAAAHASIIAREYGIPAVVGCGDATSRLQTGMRVTVDGTTGNVELI